MRTRALRSSSEDFVAEAAGSAAGTEFESIYRGNPPSRLLARSESFAVLADMSPLVAGHVLLVPRAHLPSMGAVDPARWGELLALAERVAAAERRLYGACTLVEHGSSSQLLHSPCISHAHWHFLPLEVDFAAALDRTGLPSEPIADERSLAAWASRDASYLFARADDGAMAVATPGEEKPLPRQFIRREIAAQLGHDEWDWGLPPRKGLLRRTIADLGPLLSSPEDDDGA